jgi:ribosome assembly protein RRB1
MEVTAVEEQPRRIVKVKKRVQVAEAEKLVDEDGNELEFEGEVEVMSEEEDVVQRKEDEEGAEGEEWEDEDEEEAVAAAGKREVWDESKAPLQEGEELVFDSSAYQMLHRAKVEWPCLSLDVLLRDRIGEGAPAFGQWFPNHVNTLDPKHSYKDKKRGDQQTHKSDKFPYTVYFCAGSQSLKKNENRIYVLKWSDMQKTL